MSNSALSTAGASRVERWPDGGLEAVSACPVCDGTKRELLYRELSDRVFGCAPGKWNIYACATCGSGYLDPRPSAATIGLAYSSYCTHAPTGGVTPSRPSAWRRYRTAQRNAYLNAHYGYQLKPAGARSPKWLSADRKQRFDKYTGYLRYPGPGCRLLDIGCGNGRFLMQMRSLGWEVSGVEPDPKSAAEAAAAGLNVRVGLPDTQTLPEAHYDAVSLNHVIEHLHDPVGTLRICLKILKPGGRLFVATPNFAAAGHHLFGSDWFHLDPPRHLVLFTPESLRRAMKAAGFEPDPEIRLRLTAREIFMRCAHLQNGSDPMRQKPRLPFSAKLKSAWQAWKADQETRLKPELTEELVLLARRPDHDAARPPA